MGGGPDGGGEALGGDEEGDTVGSELVEEGGHEVHELEDLDVGSGLLELLEEDGALQIEKGSACAPRVEILGSDVRKGRR